MISTSKILGVTAASVLMFAVAPVPARAESAAQSADGIEFISGINCPDPYSANGTSCYDPNAAGTKYSGTLSVVYDKTDLGGLCAGGSTVWQVNNVYATLALQQSNAAQKNVSGVFTTDLANQTHPTPLPFCFGENEDAQAKMVIEMIRTKVMKHFYGCMPAAVGCPNFKVKSLSNYQYNLGGDDVGTRGFSVDVVIGVQ